MFESRRPLVTAGQATPFSREEHRQLFNRTILEWQRPSSCETVNPVGLEQAIVHARRGIDLEHQRHFKADNRALVCGFEALKRFLATTCRGQAPPPAAAAPPRAPSAPLAQPQGASLPQSRAVLTELLQAGAQAPERPEHEIRPAFQAALRASSRAFQQDAAAKVSKVHNNANDATQCMKVEKTGARAEWGIQGRMRLVNTCAYRVEVSWCANVAECTSGHGNLWTVDGGADWPIFFTDPANPMVRIAACKVGGDRQPLPSDAALARSGGINARHNDPQPTLGVGRMLGHVCE